jgi:hypothetical protein
MNCQHCKKYIVVENENYCLYHIELKLLNDDEIKKGHKCSRCPRLVFDDNKRCSHCISISKLKRSTPQELKCMFRDGCIFNKKEGLNYCDKHKYMQDYTEEMLNNLKLCSGCKKKVLLQDGLKTCEKCLLRSKNNKQSEKNNIVLCKSEKCPNKAKENSNYCGVHNKKQFYDDFIKNNTPPDLNTKDDNQSENYKN